MLSRPNYSRESNNKTNRKKKKKKNSCKQQQQQQQKKEMEEGHTCKLRKNLMPSPGQIIIKKDYNVLSNDGDLDAQMG